MRATLTVTGSLRVPAVVLLTQPPGGSNVPGHREVAGSTRARKPVVFRIFARKVKVPCAVVRTDPAVLSLKMT